MKILYYLLAMAGIALLPGCATRSISNSGYHSGYSLYHGELSELDVLGSTANTSQPGPYTPVTVKKGDRLVVIQSGALLPDEPMLTELGKHFDVAPFSGVPGREKDPAYCDRLKNAALNGGCPRLFVYWGILETAHYDQATRTISWVPVVGRMIPDRSQNMRIRLKGFLVDAQTGRWTMYVTDSFEDQRLSAPIAREASDQRQVAKLKELAYRNLAGKLLKAD